MYVMGSKSSGSNSSPIDSEDSKHVPFDTVPDVTSEADQRKDPEGKSERQRAFAPLNTPNLSQLRSHSSARSQRSFAGADGYTHFDQDEERQQPSEKLQEGPDAYSDKEYEVTWDGDDDPMNPRSRRKARKWMICLILSASSLCVTCASALYTATYSQLEHRFHTSREVATLGLSIFVVGLGCGPMVLSPLSEFFGRRPIYICAFGMYFIWLIPCAVARNMATLLVARFFDGLAGSAFLSVAGGTVGDLFKREELSLPMMVYTASPFLGPEVGPVIGGFINQYADWRWSFYVLMIW